MKALVGAVVVVVLAASGFAGCGDDGAGEGTAAAGAKPPPASELEQEAGKLAGKCLAIETIGSEPTYKERASMRRHLEALFAAAEIDPEAPAGGGINVTDLLHETKRLLADCDPELWEEVAPQSWASEGSATAAPATSAEDPSGDEAETYLDIGEGGKDDGLGFKVLSLEEVQSIPAADEYSSAIYPPPDGKLIAATIEMKNFGSTNMDPFCGGGGAVLLDKRQRNFRYDSDALLDVGGDVVCLDGIAPGFKATVTLPFKVPPGFKMGGLVLWNPDSGDYDGEESELIVVPGGD